MSSEENFKRLGLSILMLEEKLEEIKTYAQEIMSGINKTLVNLVTISV